MYTGINICEYNKADVVLFNSYSKGRERCLSNLYPCNIEYEGKIFNSSEQLFVWLMLASSPRHQEMIMKCDTPKQVKTRGAGYLKTIQYQNCPERDIPLLRFAMQVKFNQCPEFRNFIVSNPNERYVEYAWWGDDTWGAVDIDATLKYDWYKGVVQGQNICGRLITELAKKSIVNAVTPVFPHIAPPCN